MSSDSRLAGSGAEPRLYQLAGRAGHLGFRDLGVLGFRVQGFRIFGFIQGV